MQKSHAKIFIPLFFASTLLIMGFPSVAWSMGRMPPRDDKSEESELVEENEIVGEPLTLRDCYDLALVKSETVGIQEEEIEKAKAATYTAAGDFLGDVNFVITDMRQHPQKSRSSSDGSGSVGGTFTASERRERKFVIEQPIFQGFKSLGAITGSGSLRRQRQQEWRRSEDLLFLDVVHAFYSLLQSKRDVEIIEEIHKLFEQRISDLQEREKIGRSRTSEVATSHARMKTLEAQLAESRGEFAILLHQLRFLVGGPIVAQQLQDEEISRSIENVEQDYLRAVPFRPDVEAARQAVKTARSALVVAQSDLWPTVNFEHNQYEKREGFQSGIDWDMLFTIDIPLGKGGTTFGAVKEAASKWRQAKLAYSLARRQAVLETRESYENWKTSTNKEKALGDAVHASEENFRLQKDDYLHNLVNNLDVLEALQSLLEARREANQAHYEMKENYWRFQVATGKCCSEAG